VRIRVVGGGPAAAVLALALADATGAALLDATGRVAACAAGRGPGGRDVLAGRATVAEALRSRGSVPVVGWGGPLDATGRAALARRIVREVGAVVVLG
jgi:hypothetical protein